MHNQKTPGMSDRHISRRTTLKAAGAASAAMFASGVAPALLRAQDKAGAKNPIIGSGDYVYECQHQFLQPPNDFIWQTTHNVAVDKAGNIYIKERGHTQPARDTIYVFDPQGKFMRSFGKEYFGGGHGIDIRDEGGEEFLYLSTPEHNWVTKTHIGGEKVWETRAPQEPGVYNDKAVFRPTNVAFAPDGGFYVADGYGSNYIHQYDKNGKWVRSWGGTGTEPGKMKTPHGIWYDDRPGREPSLVVADRANGRLQYFTLDGQHIGFVNGLLFPCHFDTRGELLLVADGLARLSLFDKNNQPVLHAGGDDAWIAEVKKFKIRADEKLWQPGKFIHPHDACFDHEGNILVVEWVHTGRITRLKKLS